MVGNGVSVMAERGPMGDLAPASKVLQPHLPEIIITLYLVHQGPITGKV